MELNYFSFLKIFCKNVCICFLLITNGIVFGQTIFTVNSIEDNPDYNLSDNICADANGDCTLRAAIENANLASDISKIYFDIPGEGVHEILLDKNLPPIIEPIELDATTQPGYSWATPKIIINGSNLELINVTEETPRDLIPQAFFLTGNSSGSLIKGFVLGGFGYLVEDSSGQLIEYYQGVAIQILNSKQNVIQANFIGVREDGQTPFRNIFGITTHSLDNYPDSNDNIIGGLNPEERNVIGNSWRSAILLGYKSGKNEIIGNYIGVSADGQTAMPNRHGVSVTYPSYQNKIYDNLISGNMVGAHLVGKENNVFNNVIGLNSTKDKSIPNSYGIGVINTNNIVGEVNAGNIISGNEVGICLYADEYGNIASDNVINYNYIGTGELGEISIPNKIGIQVYGTNCFNNTISDNIISGNSENGISIENGANNISILRNLIGLNANDSSLGNAISGIKISGNNNIIGSINNGNKIAFNGKGITIIDSINVKNNGISGNNIFENSIGIDLGDNSYSSNDNMDKDTGPNNYQNYPELITASYSTSLYIEYKIDSNPLYSSYPLTIEIFKSDGDRQGKEFLGQFLLSEKDLPNGKKSLTKDLNLIAGANLIPGDKIVATATDAEGNTSEFSPEIDISVTGSCLPQTFYADTDGDGLGDPANSRDECTAPAGYVSNADDCDDTDASIGAAQTWYLDSDSDGYGDPGVSETTCLPAGNYVLDNTDCDDSNSAIHPGAIDDTVDGIDENCDGTDGPVSSCLGSDFINLSEVCSTDTNVYWEISNPGSCQVNGRWELRKSSSTGASSGTFTLAPGEIIQIVSGTISKGKTQIIVYWNDSTGTEINTTLNASGIPCTSAASSLSTNEISSELVVSPNPVDGNGLGMYFPAVGFNTVLEAKIYSQSGNLLASQSFNISEGTGYVLWNLDYHNWIDGTYILNATIDNQLYQTKFIK